MEASSRGTGWYLGLSNALQITSFQNSPLSIFQVLLPFQAALSKDHTLLSPMFLLYCIRSHAVTRGGGGAIKLIPYLTIPLANRPVYKQDS